MLRGHHGASRLYRRFSRTSMNEMSSYEGTTNIADDAMRSTINRLKNRRLGPNVVSRYTPPSLARTWQPNHGIVFAPQPHTKSMSTSSVAENDSHLHAHSVAEDNYVMAQTYSEAQDAIDTVVVDPKVPQTEESQENSTETEVEMPESTFSYKPDQDLFQEAKYAAPETAASYWSHTLYRGPASPEQDAPRVKVHYCTSRHTTERVISQYFSGEKVVGFDMEWKMDVSRLAGPKENVSLIQLASEERVALIHIALFAHNNISALVAPSFKQLMEDPTVSKVGVNIKGDCTRLRNHLEINAQGVFELSHLYKLVKFSESKDYRLINKKVVSMATQVKEHLQLPMFKGMDVRGSDWSKKLNMDQITYAAGDSYAGLQLYNVMDLKRTRIDPTPPLPYHAELNKPIRLADGVVLEIDPVAEAEEEAVENEIVPSERASKPCNLPLSEVQEEADVDSDNSDPSFEPNVIQVTSGASVRTVKPPAAVKSTPRTVRVLHPKLIETDGIISDYRRSLEHANPKFQATIAHLRAYFVWSRNPDYSLGDIAAILRTPPLAGRTVQSYVLEAVRLDGEHLEGGYWDRERVKSLLISWKAGVGTYGWLHKRYWHIENQLEDYEKRKVLNDDDD